MANTKRPKADQILSDLLILSNAQIRQVLWTAREYGDHPSIKGVTGIKVGDRLMKQIEFGLKEVLDGEIEDAE